MKVKTGIVLGTMPPMPSASHPRSPITRDHDVKGETLHNTDLEMAPERAPRMHDRAVPTTRYASGADAGPP